MNKAMDWIDSKMGIGGISDLFVLIFLFYEHLFSSEMMMLPL